MDFWNTKTNNYILFLKELQQTIVKGLEKIDGKESFIQDIWQREEGGGGNTCVLKDGCVFEKGGVNFSAVHGIIPSFLQKEIEKEFPEKELSTQFIATGISIVIHPQNPLVPIIHMNIRYFETEQGVYWFGGGIDLTPHYIDKEDAHYFHTQLKNVCTSFEANAYKEYKNWADDYFFIKHRNETRGIGGIFFDKLYENKNHTKDEIFTFWKSVGMVFLPTYSFLVNKNKDKPYTEQHKRFQLIRRGRYVEFNLVYDRGTKFGLETNGRIESILISLPKYASWEYNVDKELGEEELLTLSALKKGTNWCEM